MNFKSAAEVEQVAYEMRLADFPRGLNRARINDLMNGVPPYSQDEVEKNGIAVNVNFLEGCRIAHEARAQFTGNFLKPGKYFSAKTDAGPIHKRDERSMIATKELSKIMKASNVYYETYRSKFALDILHGIGPAVWDKPDFWCPDAIGIEDVLIPANTMLTMKNLPFFSLYHSYTGPELKRLVDNEEVSSKAGWNMGLVNRCLEWIDQESMSLMGSNWPEVWSPEKMAERIKGDTGFYAGDQVPTIDCFDFYFWDDDEKSQGWKRRIILDSWSTPQASGGSYKMSDNNKRDWAKNQFLFNSKNRKVAQKWSELVSFQFADLSAVAPFRYHSVRSMGFLLYAVLHLQNRMRCKFQESIFESLMMYFRIKSMDDAERALKVEMYNRGFIDDSLQFIPAAERFQVNAGLVELGLQDNEKTIMANSSSWTMSAQSPQDKKQKTKFEAQAEIQRMTAMIGSGLQQAAQYQEFEDREIFRRFCLPNSRDPDVISFQARCLKQGLPEYMIHDPTCWDITHDRVLGQGNKSLEMVIAEQLMQFRNLYDPESQRLILRDFTMAVTDDPARTDAMVPDKPLKVTDSVHDAQLAAGALMQGMTVDIKTGMNHIEYVDTIMTEAAKVIQKIEQGQGKMATQDQILGLQNMLAHISAHIQIVSQDPNEKQRVTQWEKTMTIIGNYLKAYQQRLQEQMQQQQPQNGEAQKEAAMTQAKIQAMQVTSQAKAANTRESHAERTAQRKVQFEMEMQQKEQEHKLAMQRKIKEAGADLGSRRVEQHQEHLHEHNVHRREVAEAQRTHDQEMEHERQKAELEQKAAKAKMRSTEE
jgi:hypothetical protein